MGCHTWFSVPVVTDKKEILKLAQSFLDTTTYFSESQKAMYQLAIDNELVDPCCELAASGTEELEQEVEGEWTMYKDVSDNYCDEPRIGGYPDKIIRSYDEMIKFIEAGFEGVKYEGGEKIPHHYEFYYEESRKESFMGRIKEFFDNNPEGIITFG